MVDMLHHAQIDQTGLHVWDAETGQTVLSPFKGHTDYVRSQNFSPDGKESVVFWLR